MSTQLQSVLGTPSSMNPQYPFPNPSFPFNPLNPNPNPSFNPYLPIPPPPQPNPLPDLSTSLSSLQTLLQSSQSTLHSLSSLLPSLSSEPKPKSLIRCPSNPHHWVPPSSLFLHSLHCPSSLDLDSLIDTLQYPKTLKSEQQLIHQNKFVQPLQDPTAELCFSLDDYVDFNSNFFYQDCPGVVSLLNYYNDATQNRIFSLPGVLSVECANFVSNDDGKMEGDGGNCVKVVLPSEIWGVRCEVEQWGDYPNEYSYSALKGLLLLESVKECDFAMWVIVNSPRFGVVIDVPMRDHMLVLFRLCLKAIAREALLCHRSMDANGGQLNPKSLRFKCPVLVEVMKWLSSQLMILYGETNANLFAIAMLKHFLCNAVSNASLFPLDKEMSQMIASGKDSDSYRGQLSGKDVKEEEGVNMDENLFSRAIFVYQIAAAIAALHERSLLEERIRALRNPLPRPAYQRNAEHAYMTKKADEERKKRPDYRPLIEHDGLPTQRQHDQDTNKAKTREELLAEERDYKRRRMSYRGKKLKRTTKEVMRDIIEDYMEAIKKAGGIGCLARGDGEAGATIKSAPAHQVISFKSNHNSSKDQQDGSRKLQNENNFRDRRLSNASHSSKEERTKDLYNNRQFEDRGRTNRDRHDRDYHSRSPSRERRHGWSRESRSNRRSHGTREMNEDDHSNSNYTSHTSRQYDSKRPSSTSSSFSISSERKDKRKLDYSDRHREKRRKDGRSDSLMRDELNDRYDPAEACDVYDEQFGDSKYTRPES